MVKVKDDLTGKHFGRWTVIMQSEDHITPNGKHLATWLCECSCKNHTRKNILGLSLKAQQSTSCGCLKHELCKKYNKYDLNGEYGIGWSTNTNQEFYFDLEDYNKIKDYCWFEYIDNHRYHSLRAYDPIIDNTVNFMNVLGYKSYDHKNRNPLDNRKENLRAATLTENRQNSSKRSDNTSGIVGVSWITRDCVWKAQITVNKRNIYIGSFVNKQDAIKARLRAEAKYFGEFAPQRHLFEQYEIIQQNDSEENIDDRTTEDSGIQETLG